MCHINAWFPNKHARYSHLETFWKWAIDSTNMNKDGFGLWTPKNIYRYAPKKRLPHWTHLKSLIKGRYIITHQRLSTSGRNNQMIHPYIFNIGKDFQLVGIHNGTVSIDKTIVTDFDKYSDSYYLFKELAKSLSDLEIHKASIDQLNEGVRLALQDVLQRVIEGRLSILFSVFVNGKEHFYYYRNGPSMTVYHWFGGVYFSTVSRNIDSKTVGMIPVLNTLYYVDTDKSKMVAIGTAERIRPKYEYKPSNGTRPMATLSPKMQKVFTRAYEEVVLNTTMFTGEKAGLLKLYNMLTTNKKLIEVMDETTPELTCVYFEEVRRLLDWVDQYGHEDLDLNDDDKDNFLAWRDADTEFTEDELPFLNKQKTYTYAGRSYNIL